LPGGEEQQLVDEADQLAGGIGDRTERGACSRLELRFRALLDVRHGEQHDRERRTDLVRDVAEEAFARSLRLAQLLDGAGEGRARLAQLGGALVDLALEVGAVQRVLQRDRERRRDEREHVLLLGAIRGGLWDHRELADLLAAAPFERCVDRRCIGLRTELGAAAFDGDPRPRVLRFLDERLRDRVERGIDVDVALDEHVDRVGDAKPSGLAVELGAGVLQLVVALEERLVCFSELLRCIAAEEWPRDQAPHALEERGALRNHDPVPTAARDRGQGDLGTRISEKRGHLLDVALRDQEPVPADLVALGQGEIELDLTAAELSMGGHDAVEHLIADALLRLREPAIEVHRRHREPRDHEREPQARRTEVATSELGVFLVGEMRPEVPHDLHVLRPVDPALLVRELVRGNAGVANDVLDGETLRRDRREHQPEHLARHLVHARPHTSCVAP
jgi:hypothetical protein